MDYKTAFSIFSGILVIVGFILYVRSCVRGETKPVLSTWLTFATLDSIACIGMALDRTTNGQILASVVVGWGSFLLSIKYGENTWPLRDKLCLGGSVFTLVLWGFFETSMGVTFLGEFSPRTVGVVLSMSVMVLGCVPMLVETLKDPTREDPIAWSIYGISCLFMLGGLRDWSIIEAVQPVAFALIEISMMLITLSPVLRRFLIR